MGKSTRVKTGNGEPANIGISVVDKARADSAQKGLHYIVQSIRVGHRAPTIGVRMTKVTQTEADRIRRTIAILDARPNGGRFPTKPIKLPTRDELTTHLASTWLTALFNEYKLGPVGIESSVEVKELIPEQDTNEAELRRMQAVASGFLDIPAELAAIPKAKTISGGKSQLATHDDFKFYATVLNAFIELSKRQNPEFQEVTGIKTLWKRDLLRISKFLEEQEVVEAIADLIGRTPQDILNVVTLIEAPELLHIETIAELRFEAAVADSAIQHEQESGSIEEPIANTGAITQTNKARINVAVKKAVMAQANAHLLSEIMHQHTVGISTILPSVLVKRGKVTYFDPDKAYTFKINSSWFKLALHKPEGQTNMLDQMQFGQFNLLVMARTHDIFVEAMLVRSTADYLLNVERKGERSVPSELLADVELLADGINEKLADNISFMTSQELTPGNYQKYIDAWLRVINHDFMKATLASNQKARIGSQLTNRLALEIHAPKYLVDAIANLGYAPFDLPDIEIDKFRYNTDDTVEIPAIGPSDSEAVRLTADLVAHTTQLRTTLSLGMSDRFIGFTPKISISPLSQPQLDNLMAFVVGEFTTGKFGPSDIVQLPPDRRSISRTPVTVNG